MDWPRKYDVNHFNYKGLPYNKAMKRFVRDYRLKYWLYGRRKLWRTAKGHYIRVQDLPKRQVANIVRLFGPTHIREEHPFIYYRYIKIKRLDV